MSRKCMICTKEAAPLISIRLCRECYDKKHEKHEKTVEKVEKTKDKGLRK